MNSNLGFLVLVTFLGGIFSGGAVVVMFIDILDIDINEKLEERK